VQDVSDGSKRTAIHNVLTELAEKVEMPMKELTTPDDKVVLTMYMESECPACRRFSTTIVKEILAAPGVGEIVDFRAVAWGWGQVVEAPTQKQLQVDPHAYNILNRTAQLMPILARLGALGAETPPIHFECQHGAGECAGNAVESCLQDVAPRHQQFFPVMDCLESRTCAEGMEPPACLGQPIDVVQGCLEEYGQGISVEHINACYQGARVQELMIMNDLETVKAKPQWVPWFQVDGQALVDVPKTGGNDTALFREQFLMGKRICDLYVAKTGNTAPKGCATFPQSDAEVPQNPFARFAETNFTSLIAKLDLEKHQAQHATLKKAASATVSASNKTPAVSAQQMTPSASHKIGAKPLTPPTVIKAGAKKAVAKMAVRTTLAKTASATPIKSHVNAHASAHVNMPPVALPTKFAKVGVALPKKIIKVKQFAGHFFGHDKVHKGMAKKPTKLIKAASKPVVAGNRLPLILLRRKFPPLAAIE